jgi:hypothetical protein
MKQEKRYCSFCGREMILDYLSADEFDYPIRYDKKTGEKLLYPRYRCGFGAIYNYIHKWSLFRFNPHDNYILTDSPIKMKNKKIGHLHSVTRVL